MRCPEVNVRGGTLFGEARGEGMDYLLLHAGGEDRTVWRPVMDALAAAGASSAAYDQRGHGESGGSKSDGVSAYGDDVAAMLAAQRGLPIVAGASLGGFAAILALADPAVQARAAGLVLVDVVPVKDMERVRRFLRQLGPEIATSPLVENILGQSDRIASAVAAIRLPILLVRAGDSGPVSDEDAAHLQAHCPHVQFARIAEAGHLVARDSPQRLAETLLEFRANMRAAARQAIQPHGHPSAFRTRSIFHRRKR
tara:strand:- start:2018 stop:2779 length:762 start_codon:yes stop_codon:yes gene_type:complete